MTEQGFPIYSLDKINNNGRSHIYIWKIFAYFKQEPNLFVSTIYLLHSTNVTRDILVLNFRFLITEKSDILWLGHADAKQNTKTE